MEHFRPHAIEISAIAQASLYCGVVYINIFILCSEPTGHKLLNHSPGEETTKGPLPTFFMNLKGLLSQLQIFSINTSYVYKNISLYQEHHSLHKFVFSTAKQGTKWKGKRQKTQGYDVGNFLLNYF